MKDRQALKAKIKKQLVWYSFIIVSIITLVVLTYIPMLTSIKYSFHDIQVLGFGKNEFIGFQNYEKIMHNSSFVKAIGNTFLLAAMSLVSIPIGNIAFMIFRFWVSERMNLLVFRTMKRSCTILLL